MVPDSGVSKKKSSAKRRYLPSDHNDFCDCLKFLQEEKQVGNTSEIIYEEIVAIEDKVLEYKCISTKQHKLLLVKYLHQMKSMKLIESI